MEDIIIETVKGIIPKLDISGFIIRGCKKAFITFTGVSYWVLLIYSIICLILFIYGYEDKKKHIAGSVVIYFIIKALESVVI